MIKLLLQLAQRGVHILHVQLKLHDGPHLLGKLPFECLDQRGALDQLRLKLSHRFAIDALHLLLGAKRVLVQPGCGARPGQLGLKLRYRGGLGSHAGLEHLKLPGAAQAAAYLLTERVGDGLRLAQAGLQHHRFPRLGSQLFLEEADLLLCDGCLGQPCPQRRDLALDGAPLAF